MEKMRGLAFVSGSSAYSDRIATIRDVFRRFGVIIDPRTADGIKVGLKQREAGVPLICVETAQPVKFAEAIKEALGRARECPDHSRSLEQLPQRV